MIVTNRDLTRIVRNYLDKLEYTHPLINSEKFTRNSYSKWACKELLRYITSSEQVPFHLTPYEILDGFIDRMRSYAGLNARNAEAFLIAADVGSYIYEELCREKNQERKHEK